YDLLKNTSLRDWLAADWNRAGLAIEEFLRFIASLARDCSAGKGYGLTMWEREENVSLQCFSPMQSEEGRIWLLAWQPYGLGLQISPGLGSSTSRTRRHLNLMTTSM